MLAFKQTGLLAVAFVYGRQSYELLPVTSSVIARM